MNTQTITLDVTKKPDVMPVVRMRQGDKNGTTVKAEIYDNGKSLNVTNYDVKFCLRISPDYGYYEVDGTTSGNVATFEIDETYAAGIPGETENCYVEILNGDSVIYSTGNIYVVVLPSATEGEQAGTYYNGVERFIEESEQRVEDALDAIGDISELAVPLMSTDVRGGAKLGSGLEIVDGYLNATGGGGSEYVLPTASATRKGGVKIGDGLSMSGEVLNADGYTLPAATTSTLGGVIPDGQTITVDGNGTIHGANSYVLPKATDSTLGGVMVDGTSVTVDSDGTIHATGGDEYTLPTMSASTKGGAKLGSGLAIANDTLSLVGESYTSTEKSKLAGIAANANNYSLPAATTSTLGGVIPDGTTVTVDSNGTIHSAGGSEYTLPTMASDTKGGAKLGSGLQVASDVLSVDASTIASGVLPVAYGGTGKTTEYGIRSNYGAACYFNCDTQAATAAKATYNYSGFELKAGQFIIVHFLYGNTADEPTLNVSGTGAVSIYYNGAKVSASNPLKWRNASQLLFVYSYSVWRFICDVTVHNNKAALQTFVCNDISTFTPPQKPCFIYDTSDNGFYYEDGL